MRYATVINVQATKGRPAQWAVATRDGDVIDHQPLLSQTLEGAVAEAKKKLGRGWRILVPNRGERIPKGAL